MRHGRTMGGPIAHGGQEPRLGELAGQDGHRAGAEPPPPVTRLRPGHADLAGVVKYGLDDVRNVLERASARETAVARRGRRRWARSSCASSASRSAATCGGSGRRGRRRRGRARQPGSRDAEIAASGPRSKSRTSAAPTPRLRRQHDRARSRPRAPAGDTLGGIFEVIAYGAADRAGHLQPVGREARRAAGRGGHEHPVDQGVEIGDGFANAAPPRLDASTTSSTTTPSAAGCARPTAPADSKAA